MHLRKARHLIPLTTAVANIYYLCATLVLSKHILYFCKIISCLILGVNNKYLILSLFNEIFSVLNLLNS